MSSTTRILLTGITGYVGGALVPALEREGHEVHGLTRDPDRHAGLGVPLHRGDVLTGAGLAAALDGVDVAFYLVHSMERGGDGTFHAREERGARTFADAARRAGVERIVYLGGLVPRDAPVSPHLASRLRVEELLLEGVPGSVALRASIVVGARSRSFRFLVRLVERLPVLALPPWARNLTQPVDGRDMTAMLVGAATAPAAAGRSLDAVGPDVLSYGAMIERIRDLMLVARPSVGLPFGARAVAARVAAAIAGEDPDLIGPLMGSLESDLLPRSEGHDAATLLGVRPHGFERAVERALRDWERLDPGSVAAR